MIEPQQEGFMPVSMSDRTSVTDDERIAKVTPIPPPEHLIRFFPIQGTPAETTIVSTRRLVCDIIRKSSPRLLVIVGPCSIHDPQAAIEFAQRLVPIRKQLGDQLEILMRVYFEKPRSTVGWKGLINDPYLDNSYRINEGLRIARDLLIRINQFGIPAGSEFLDVISPQYIGDLISWGAIGARTTESQIHRELASGVSAPVGFKNGTDGNIKIAVDACLAAREPHHFLSVHKNGSVAMVETQGNADCHLILRGGSKPNYDATSIEDACTILRKAHLPERVMIDFSHANSNKKFEQQTEVAKNVAEQIAGGEQRIVGVMVESHLVEGRQDLTDPQKLRYGQSITDGCLGWMQTLQVLETLAEAVSKRQGK